MTEPAPARSTRTVRTRGALIVSGRIVAGTAGLVAAAALVAATLWAPLPTLTAGAAHTAVTPQLSEQMRVCAGAALRYDDETEAAVGIEGLRLETSTTAGAPDATRQPIDNTGSTQGSSSTVATVPAGDATAPAALAGATSQLIETEEISGFVAAECVEPRSDTWLVGGSTSTGRTTLIVLTNPGEVAASVTLSFYGADGPIDAPGADGIILAPHSETVLPLAGFAPGQASPVVHAVSAGSPIVARMLHTTTRVLEPGGAAWVAPSAPPARSLTIPGFVTIGHDTIEERTGAPGFDDIEPLLRFFVPGDQDTRVTVSLTPENGEAQVATEIDLRGGSVTDFALEHFADGTYTVGVTAEIPILVGAHVSVVGAESGSDHAWYTAPETLLTSALVQLAPGPEPVLHLHNPTAADATVDIAAGVSGTRSVTIPAGATHTERGFAAEGETVTLDGFAELRATVTYAGENQLGGYPITPPAPTSQQVTVYP